MKEMRKFLRKRRPMEVDVRGARGQFSKCYLLKDTLAILNANKTILYPLSYVDSWNTSRFIPDGHVAFMDTLFKIDDVIDSQLEPSRFMDVLTTPPMPGDPHTRYGDVDTGSVYTIEIDGELVYEGVSSMKCERARNQFLKERKRGSIIFDHMKVMDGMGNRTDFLFNQTH